jgi:Tol biopolymer transport system component
MVSRAGNRFKEDIVKNLVWLVTVLSVLLIVVSPVGLHVQASPSAPAAGTTERLSVATGGSQGTGDSSFPFISSDGRYVVFHSAASNLVSGDTNFSDDVFLRDRQSMTTERVSVADDESQGDDFSRFGAISADGRYVSFLSAASNLVVGDNNGFLDVFVRDRQLGTTERVSVSSAGTQSNDGSNNPAISADGRFVAFRSHATNLVSGDTNNVDDIFVRDLVNDTTERISVSYNGTNPDLTSSHPSLSADGRYVAFYSDATNLLSPGVDTNGWGDIFIRDRQAGLTERVSVASNGGQQNLPALYPTISADGQYVVFQSFATNLVSGDSNVKADIFIHYRATGTTERVSVATGGGQADDDSEFSAVSADGRYVAFSSKATNLVGGDTNVVRDIFIRDRLIRTTERLSVANDDSQGNNISDHPAISDNGQYAAFESTASNLITDDTNGFKDVFLRDRGAQAPLVNTYLPIVNR